MNEAADTAANLWPTIALAVYWAYLLVWHERQKQDGRHTQPNSTSRPRQPTQSKELLRTPRLSAAAAEAAFDPHHFLVGARRAYEFIVNSYAAGKIDDLVELLDPSVLEVFVREVERREAEGEHLTLTIVAIGSCKIMDRDFDDVATTVTVRFEAEMLLSNADGTSNPQGQQSARLLQAADLWTFRREHESSGPVWTLIATDTD